MGYVFEDMKKKHSYFQFLLENLFKFLLFDLFFFVLCFII